MIERSLKSMSFQLYIKSQVHIENQVSIGHNLCKLYQLDIVHKQLGACHQDCMYLGHNLSVR